jgi:thymidylate synthase (FAD)
MRKWLGLRQKEEERMKLINPSFSVIEITPDPLNLITRAGRTCYQSWNNVNKLSLREFGAKLIKMGHETPLEHASATVSFIIDRGISHELVRHRLASYSQESTRYVSYKNGVTFIIPPWVEIEPRESNHRIHTPDFFTQTVIWHNAMLDCQNYYLDLLNEGWSPQQARLVLPSSTKTELVMTANFREWRHIFKLRCAIGAHPQMREIMIPLRDKFRELVPVVFDEEVDSEISRLRAVLKRIGEHPLVMEQGGVDNADRCCRVINKLSGRVKELEDEVKSWENEDDYNGVE